jgi:hypothetical protein
MFIKSREVKAVHEGIFHQLAARPRVSVSPEKKNESLMIGTPERAKPSSGDERAHTGIADYGLMI